MPVAEWIVVVDPRPREANLVVGEQRAVEGLDDMGGVRPARQDGHRRMAVTVLLIPPQLGKGASFLVDVRQFGVR